MASGSRALAVPAEDWDLVPSTYKVAQNQPVTPVPRAVMPSEV